MKATKSSPEQSASSSAGAREMLALVRTTARKALELDPTLAQAHTMVGIASISQDADVTAGTRELESAALMAPDSPDALIHAGLWRALRGQTAEARTATEHALNSILWDWRSALWRDKSSIVYATMTAPSHNCRRHWTSNPICRGHTARCFGSTRRRAWMRKQWPPVNKQSS